MESKFLDKFLGDTFKDISKRSWISSQFWYMINSKEYIRKELDKFLKEQIDNPHPELVEVSKQFLKYYKSPDRMIIEILRYVKNRVKYESDRTNFGMAEYWANAYETWKRQKDDCDGINALIYVLMRLASAEIINNYLFCMLCDTNPDDTASFDHFALIYFSVKTGKWYSIDGTYYPDFTEIKNRTPFKLIDIKYASIDFIFNEKFVRKAK